MRGNNLIVLCVAIVFGIAAAVLSRNWLATHVRSSETAMGTIVVAAKPLNFGSQLTDSNTVEIPWTKTALPDGAFATRQDLLKDGRRMTLALIAKNEPILRTRVTAPNQPATLSSLLPPGDRAVTVRVDDVRGVAGFIQPGDLVDVVLIRTIAESRGNESYSEVILQSAKVLAIDQITGEHREQPTIAKAVTLEVGIKDAQKILLATNIGRLSLVLREPIKTAAVAVQRVTERDLDGDHIAEAKPVPPQIAPVVATPPPPVRAKPLARSAAQITVWHGMKSQEYQAPFYAAQNR
jgi:pilus assembly protein CpaB